MSNPTQRRDWLLKSLGITQWQLRHPPGLQDKWSCTRLMTPRLALVADPHPSMADVLLEDILRALKLTGKQVCCVLPEQMTLLPNDCLCWVLGDSTLGNSTRSTVRPLMHSPTLDQLQFDAQAKRHLWQQICHYADYFTLTSH